MKMLFNISIIFLFASFVSIVEEEGRGLY